MKILTLDLGKSTGWAIMAPEVESGTQRSDLRRGESPGMGFIRFRRWLIEMIDYAKPEVVVYELPHHRGGAATEILVGMSTRVQEICADEGIEYQSVHTATLKKFATGSGRASKDDMIDAAKEKFPDQVIETHDQADALCLLQWAMETLAGL